MTDKMAVAGVMSGTSADGINVALVEIGGSSRHPGPVPLQLVGHLEHPYPERVRAAVLSAMNSPAASVADLARLNFLLGELYADAVLRAERQFRLKAELVGCHGQTLYHQGEARPYLGHKLAVTWQTGEGAIVAAKIGVPVVSDFRPADMAVGGKGAPLVPFLDFALFRHPHVGRVVQNIGGIANLTAIPAGADEEEVTAFDTGPGNMVIDAVTEKLFGRPFDRGGKIASTGRVLDHVVERILRRTFFHSDPPKTAGREEFGREFTGEFLRLCGRNEKEDVVATATALTARSVALAVRQMTTKVAVKKQVFHEMIVSGGGAKNATLMAMLGQELAAIDIRLRLSDELGLPSAAKEAAAFALLAYRTWRRLPANIPSATGARHPAVLGKIAFPAVPRQ
ncbi:MAG TPA: anhydro-N-acetylmuramic acid kinase [Candidatus Binatia bacterium]|nr:anhydro-N-acetylmuramic acid kinase [Candidatus Binatia bacterium]